MIGGKTPVSAILKINGHFLFAALQGGASVLLWPSSLEWWGFGLLSVLLGLSAVASVVTALRDVAKVYAREKEVARFTAMSRAPEPSDLADQDALKSAGMIND